MMRRAARAIILNDDKILVMHRNKFGQEYDILIGGGIEIGEEPEDTVKREILEESHVKVGPLKLVFIERAEEPYGTQYIFLCNYLEGELKLDHESTEAKINLLGKNLYEPKWRDIKEFPNINFRSKPLQLAIINGFKNGFPQKPIDITNFNLV